MEKEIFNCVIIRDSQMDANQTEIEPRTDISFKFDLDVIPLLCRATDASEAEKMAIEFAKEFFAKLGHVEPVLNVVAMELDRQEIHKLLDGQLEMISISGDSVIPDSEFPT